MIDHQLSFLAAYLKGNFELSLFSEQHWNDGNPENGDESNEQRRRWHMGKVTNHLRTHIHVGEAKNCWPLVPVTNIK